MNQEQIKEIERLFLARENMPSGLYLSLLGHIEKTAYRTKHVAADFNVSQAAIRHHLKNIRAEGHDIGWRNRWYTHDEVKRVCDLIRPRIGRHCRRNEGNLID